MQVTCLLLYAIPSPLRLCVASASKKGVEGVEDSVAVG